MNVEYKTQKYKTKRRAKTKTQKSSRRKKNNKNKTAVRRTTTKRIHKNKTRNRKTRNRKWKGGFMTVREYSSGANDFQRKIVNTLFPDWSVWATDDIVPPKMILFERRKDTGNFDLIYDEHMLLSDYCKRFYKGSGSFHMLRDYTNQLYSLSTNPIEVTFSEVMILIRDSFVNVEYTSFTGVMTEEVKNQPDQKQKFRIAIRDGIFQIARMANAISIFYDNFYDMSILSLNKSICSIKKEDRDLVYDSYFRYHLSETGNKTTVGNLISTKEAGNFVICRINILLLFIVISSYKDVFASLFSETTEELTLINTRFIERVQKARKENSMDPQIFIDYTIKINSFCIEKAEQIESMDEDRQEQWKIYKEEQNSRDISDTTKFLGPEGKRFVKVPLPPDIILRKPLLPNPKLKPLFNKISLQAIYSMLILFQGNSFFNEYFGKIFAVTSQCDYDKPVITRGLSKSDIPFIIENSAKINSLFDLGPLDQCASSSKPMIENYLTNSKSCIVKVNSEGQIVVETTFAYLVIFQEKIVAVILSKDEANLSTNSYKQMDQIRSVVTQATKDEILRSLDPNSGLGKFLSELQPLDQYNRQSSHKYDGKFCVFLGPNEGSYRTGTSEKERKCMQSTLQTTTSKRGFTDRLKHAVRGLGIGNDTKDTTGRDPSPLELIQEPVDESSSPPESQDSQESEESQVDIPDNTVHSLSSLSNESVVPLVKDDTRFSLPLASAACPNKP